MDDSLKSWIDDFDNKLLKSHIPDYMKPGVRRYVVDGIPPGHFLTAVFSSDLMGALKHGDALNLGHLVDFGRFIYNHCPMGCQGSKENFKSWQGVIKNYTKEDGEDK